MSDPADQKTDDEPERPAGIRRRLDTALYSFKYILESIKRGPNEPEAETEPLKKQNWFLAASLRVHRMIGYEDGATSLAPYGYYTGRPIIGECTRVNGGIYVGAKPQEAVVVDDRYGALKRVFSKACGRCIVLREQRQDFEEAIFDEISAISTTTLQYSPDGVRALLEREGVAADKKVTLDVFIEAGVGVARHRVLLAAYLLEKLRDMGIISGLPAIDRAVNERGEEQESLYYTDPSGQVFEFDPAETPKIVKS